MAAVKYRGYFQVINHRQERENGGFARFFSLLEGEIGKNGAAKFAQAAGETARLALASDGMNAANVNGLLKILEWGAFILERQKKAHLEAADVRKWAAMLDLHSGNLFGHRHNSIAAFRNLCYAAQQQADPDAAVRLAREAFAIRAKFERTGDFWETYPYFFALRRD